MLIQIVSKLAKSMRAVITYPDKSKKGKRGKLFDTNQPHSSST